MAGRRSLSQLLRWVWEALQMSLSPSASISHQTCPLCLLGASPMAPDITACWMAFLLQAIFPVPPWVSFKGARMEALHGTGQYLFYLLVSYLVQHFCASKDTKKVKRQPRE